MKAKRTKIKINKIKGRGVYADELIKEGELIEVCQMLVVGVEEVGPTLERYVFYFSDSKSAMALGNGPLYNHTDDLNAYVEMDDDELIIEFTALKTIKKGEEITIDYGYTLEERKKFGIR